MKAAPDLFQEKADTKPVRTKDSYTAHDIEVLEGLEPVRMRPGMYIGGTDSRALHHMVAEILDNSMDEAVAGYASRIDIAILPDNFITIQDDGRGIPVDPHPKFKDKSALEVILTTLHSGAKFSQKTYNTSGGLHGVGLSVVNALSSDLTIEVSREKKLWRQRYAKGVPLEKLHDVGKSDRKKGTRITFTPDPEIFEASAHFSPTTLYRLVRAKAYLFRGVKIYWSCARELIPEDSKIPEEEIFHFPNGLHDYLEALTQEKSCVVADPFCGEAPFSANTGRVEWAVTWFGEEDGFTHSYCNTIPTSEGGSHEQGLRSAFVKAMRAYGDLLGVKKAQNLTAEDIFSGAAVLLSVFLPDPQFQGQTKEKLSSPGAAKLVETTLRDRFDHWLSQHPDRARTLLDFMLERADERARRKQEKDLQRKSATKRLRLPGKLTDCSRSSPKGTELFLVEGDSAGGTAKQARNREFQAILPLRGKILNVANASLDKLQANQEVNNIFQALGIHPGKPDKNLEVMRYEKIIIMTDADVDGAHIASLLITFFYKELREIVDAGRLYLAQPPLYRLTQGNKSMYARDDRHKDELLTGAFKKGGKVDIARFKGLGEMSPLQLRETTMNVEKRALLRVVVIDSTDPLSQNSRSRDDIDKFVENLMGKKAEARFRFIQDNARFIQRDELDI